MSLATEKNVYNIGPCCYPVQVFFPSVKCGREIVSCPKSQFDSRLPFVFAKGRQRRFEMSEMRTRRLRIAGMSRRSNSRSGMQVCTQSLLSGNVYFYKNVKFLRKLRKYSKI